MIENYARVSLYVVLNDKKEEFERSAITIIFFKVLSWNFDGNRIDHFAGYFLLWHTKKHGEL